MKYRDFLFKYKFQLASVFVFFVSVSQHMFVLMDEYVLPVCLFFPREHEIN